VVGPTAFVDDVLLFPAGLTNLPSPARTTTLGTMMIGPAAGASPRRVVMTLLLLGLAALVTAGVLRAFALRRNIGASETAAAAALVLVALCVLAPTARAGYAIYPFDLLAWAVLYRRRTVAAGAPHREAFAW
jgi:hypothetical protein